MAACSDLPRALQFAPELNTRPVHRSLASKDRSACRTALPMSEDPDERILNNRASGSPSETLKKDEKLGTVRRRGPFCELFVQFRTVSAGFPEAHVVSC